MIDDEALDAYLDSGTALLGIPVRREWRDGIRQHLLVSFRLGSLVVDFPLPDESEPAPVFAA